MGYAFANAQNTAALRDDNNTSVPWDPTKRQPVDVNGHAGRMWRDAGSPQPTPYAAPLPPPVTAVTRVQGMIQLSRSGLLSQVQSLVASDPEMQIWFNNAPTWERNNSRILALAQSLGLSATDLDNLFKSAGAIAP